MQEASTGDFMTGIRDLPHEFRILFRDPAQHKERCLRVVLFQQSQCLFRILLQPRFEPIPVPWTDVLMKGPGLEVVFQIDRQNLSARGIGHSR